MADHDRQAESTIPAGVACAGCGYELAGLPRGGVCPECGLDVPASWPVWDLRRCAKPYVEHVQDELRMLNWATMAAWVVLASAAVAGLGAALEPHGGAVAATAMFLGLLAIAGLVPLPVLVLYAWQALRRHANDARSPGAALRRRLRWGAGIGMAGLVMALLFIAAGFLTGQSPGPAYVATTAILAVGGLGWASIEAMAYAGAILGRAGMPGVGRGLLPGWGFALAVLAVVAAGSMFVDLGRPLALVACSAALLGPATALAVRLGRARAVVDALLGRMAGPDPA